MREVTGSEIFSFAETTIQRQRIEPRKEDISILPDGTKVFCNESGEIEYAHYKNGATLGRFNTFVLVANSSSGHWFRDRANRWHTFD
jgi:hypothetical protein